MTKSPVETIFVGDEKGLLRVRWWAQEHDFTEVHTAANAAGKPAVAILKGGIIVGGVICGEEWLQRHVETILEAVLIRREDAEERSDAK